MTRRLEEILRLEEVALATWPALEEHRDGQWVLRAAAGITGRSNSVSPLGAPDADLETAIADVERWYSVRRLPPRFRLTDLAPSGLDDLLVSDGYHSEPEVAVMVLPIGRRPAPSEVRIEPAPSEAWFGALMAHRFGPRTPPATVRAMLDRLAQPAAYASLSVESTMLGMGMGVLFQDFVAVYAMYTADAHRHRGVASRILGALLAWGSGNGATNAFLQVLAENTAARSFYARRGFETMYHYWYRLR